MKPLIFILLCYFSFCRCHAVIYYVTVSGSGLADGSSWVNARPASGLQIAINAAGPGDQIWVAAGTYIPVTGAGRLATFSLRNNVEVYGSFAGTESLLSERNLSAGLTSILSGELGAPGISDNAYHTVTNSGLNNTAVIDGFIIRDANDDRPSSLTDGLGGGIYNNGSGPGNTCSPVIRNCVIINNRASFGAGVFNNGYNSGTSNPQLVNCVIAGNTATAGGGGIDNFGVLNGNASPAITNCVLYGNTAAQRAGAMYCWAGNLGNTSPTVLNTVFVNNSAIDGGAVVSDRLNSGGGSSGTSNPVFRNCIFWGNTASGTGPQFFLLGGATFTATYTDIDLTGQLAPHIISGPGTGNLNANPLFLNIALGAGADASWLTADDGLQLSGITSPCYNSGDNTGLPATDILSGSRILDGTADMGAYEFNSSPLSADVFWFTAEASASFTVDLNWWMPDRNALSGFSIEKSRDAIHFEEMSFVPTSGSHSYHYTDSFPHPGVNYYRIRFVNPMGMGSYYSEVRIAETGKREIVLFPNPASGQIFISGISGLQNVRINDSRGITLRESKTETGSLDISGLPPGMYFLSAESKGMTVEGYFLVQ